jgi:hypothetical protein
MHSVSVVQKHVTVNYCCTTIIYGKFMTLATIKRTMYCGIVPDAELKEKNILDVHGSVHNINRIEITNKMQPCSRIYYSNVS